MKTRNEIYGGTFSSPEAPDTNANGELKKLVLSDSADITKNRSSWIRTIFYNIMDSFTHKTEDRATSANLGVSGAEPTTTKYTTVEQLPSVDKLTNDFSVVASESDGDLTTTQDMFTITPVTTGTNKVHKVAFSLFGVKWLKARTWKQSEIEDIVVDTVNNPSGGGLIPVGVIWDYTGAHTVDPDGFLNLCNEYGGSARSISNTAGTGTLHNDKYEALFTHLWTNFANTECAVSGGRGASAAADWTANKDIKLPDYRGRVGGYYKLSDVNFGTLGKQIGTETINAIHLPVTAPYGVNNPPHNHGNVVIVNGASSESLDGDTVGLRASAGNTDNTTTTISLKTNDIAGGQVADGGQKHFQPTIIQTAIIKY